MSSKRRTSCTFWLALFLLALKIGEAYNNNPDFYNGARDFTVCDDSVVKVTALYAVCDSPYTFYYGNGANRNSPVCNYGDKLSFEVRFQVVDDILDDSSIFVTMAVYDDQNQLLISIDPVYLCEDLVGYECTSAGYYGFTYYRLRLPYPYESNDNQYNNNNDDYSSSSSSGGSSRFLPKIQMAFSTKDDSGYNLGALNLECVDWGGNDNYVEWSKLKPQRSPLQAFFVDYGMLLGSCAMVVAVSAFVWHQASKIKVKNAASVVEPDELDDGYKSIGLID